MKKFYQIMTLLAACSLLFVSCNKKELVYEEGAPELANSYGVYFPTQDASGSHTYDPLMDRSITVTVARPSDKSNGAITVPYTIIASEEGIFKGGDITFADGQTETEVDITFQDAGEGVKYNVELVIDDPNYVYVYGSNPKSLSFSILVVTYEYVTNPETGEPAKVTFTVMPDFLSDFDVEEAYEVEGKIRYYEVDGVRYGSVLPDEGGIWKSDAVIDFTWYPNITYEYDGNSYQPVEVAVQSTGYMLDGEEVGMPDPCGVSFTDYYHYWTDVRGNSLGTYAQFMKNYGQTYKLCFYDGRGGFYFNLIYTIDGTNYWYGFCDGTVVGIAEGFVRTDYTLEAETDYSHDGVTPVSLKAGADIATVKYAVYPGELTDKEVAAKAEAIASGEDASEEFTDLEYDEEEKAAFGSFGLTPESTGTYTLVLVGFDEGKTARANTSVTFKFIAAEDVEEYAVDLMVGTEDVPARYVDYDNITAFGYYLVGSDIKEAHVAVFLTENYEKNPEGYAAFIKSETKLALSEDAIKQVNATGGYFNLASGLDPLTNYTVLVWATNGDSETVLSAERMTDGLPLAYVTTGTYTYDAWWEGDDDEQELYTDPNYPGTYVLTNWGGGVNFRFTVDKDNIITIPLFAIGATHSSYGAVWYIESADYYSEEYLASHADAAERSYYDPETGVYHFHFALVVSAGTFGNFWETFAVGDTATESHVAVSPQNVPVSSTGIGSHFRIPSFRQFERDPQAVKVKVTPLAPRKTARSHGKNNEVPTLAY